MVSTQYSQHLGQKVLSSKIPIFYTTLRSKFILMLRLGVDIRAYGPEANSQKGAPKLHIEVVEGSPSEHLLL